MDSLDFTLEEIQEQLALLGYKNIPKHRLLEFKQDLDELIQHGEWKSLASPTHLSSIKYPTDKCLAAASQPSPPAYIKEKVGQSYFEDCGQGFYLHTGQSNHNRQMHTTCRNIDNGRRQGHCDSYAKHSVAPKLQLPPGAPTRLQVEPDPDDTLLPPLTDSYTSSPDTQGRGFVKRKVLRKHKGQSHVCDESVYSEYSDAPSLLEERLAKLRLSSPAPRDYETEREDLSSQSEDLSGRSEDLSRQSEAQSDEAEAISMSAFESYFRSMTRSRSDGDIRPKPKSFIRPLITQPAVKKSDPVAKYFQYKQLWEMFKLPGETDRRALRQEIREQLAYQPPPPKPRRVFVRNTYVVPTEKKRSSLRWAIRNDLASGLLPHKLGSR